MSRERLEPMRIFLDANVLISAAWRDGCEMAQLWQMRDVRLLTSSFVMGEVVRNLPRIDQIERLRGLMRTVEVIDLAGTEVPEALELPEKDRPVLLGAVAAKAALLVSGDKKHFGPFYGRTIQGVRITAPSELLQQLRATGG